MLLVGLVLIHLLLLLRVLCNTLLTQLNLLTRLNLLNRLNLLSLWLLRLNALLNRHGKNLWDSGVNNFAVWKLSDLRVCLLAVRQGGTLENDSDVFCFLSSAPSSWDDGSTGFDVSYFPHSVGISLVSSEVVDKTINGFSLRVCAKMFVNLVWRDWSSRASIFRVELLC